MSRPEWWQDWRGQTAIVVASGPSAGQCNLSLAKGRAKFIAANSSWELAPWAAVLFAADDAWWEVHHRRAAAFGGLKLAGEECTGRKYGLAVAPIDRDATDQMVLDRPYKVASANSGFTALNLAVQFGAPKVLLVGFDVRVDKGLHWHGQHDRRLNNPNVERTVRWRKILDDAAPALAAHGVEVINCSSVSALTAYPKVPFEQAIEAIL